MSAALIPFIDLKSQYEALQESIDARIAAVLRHGQFILGEEVHQLETRLARFTGAPYCITVASGTEALLIALMAIGIKPGDEVITTPFTFVATVEVIALLGAVPVMVDIEPDTCNIDARQIESAVTPRTRAIIPVSLYGQPADMDEINELASRLGLVVIEDAAQSFGATYKGARSCNISRIACTSFFPSKPLGCYGDGGAVFTSDEAVANACREIRVHGQSKRYVHTRIGVGGRMDTIQCAVVLAKLDRFEWEIARRTQLGARYNEAFDLGGVRRVVQRPDRSSVFAQYTALVDGRDGVQAALSSQGIPTAVHYPIPLNLQPAYRDICRGGPTPVAEQAAQSVLSLPMSADLSESQQDAVVSAVLAACGTH